VKDTHRYVIHAYEDARQKRPMKHEHGGTTVLTDRAMALRRAEELATAFPDGGVYIHLEYRVEEEMATEEEHREEWIGLYEITSSDSDGAGD